MTKTTTTLRALRALAAGPCLPLAAALAARSAGLPYAGAQTAAECCARCAAGELLALRLERRREARRSRHAAAVAFLVGAL